VEDLALEQIRDCREMDVGMGPHVDPAAGLEHDRPHVVPEDERTDEPSLARGQHAAHREAAQIAGPCSNDEIDGARVSARALGLFGREEAHLLTTSLTPGNIGADLHATSAQ
jgi:hypothetical protein